ncbi:MAG TPA: 16S rRNA (adenine(1518)-N(6)/adenine(1519)-N(6))-dimethyltransferase RsmA [Ktedonobacterales bacterium]|nr:16S rRNA (adenine(1518)-N(6)/adenine(1519)-N(6))-dimethyltransferase RsmA [Ktedonobacterales bacterium]
MNETSDQPIDQPTALDLTDIGTLKSLLRRHGLAQPNKRLGQHLLVSRKALDAVVNAAELTPDDNALEVGAGPGALTVELAQRAGRVVAIEMDRDILPVLAETTAPYANVKIVPRDLLTVDLGAVFGGAPYKFVANLPYYITALIMRRILEARPRPTRMVVMTQREVAERMVAPAGDLSLLGLSVQFYGQPSIITFVPATAFYPPPKVESAVVRIDTFPTLPLDDAGRDLLFSLAHAAFGGKRKQIHNSLAQNLRLGPEQVERWLSASGIDVERRAQSLSLDEWLRLTRAALADPPQPIAKIGERLRTRREQPRRRRRDKVEESSDEDADEDADEDTDDDA